MALRLLVDECLLDKLFVEKLRIAGHDIETVTTLALTGKSDGAVFAAAVAAHRLVITINCNDFVELSNNAKNRKASHPGILLIYQYADPGRNLSHDVIIKAIFNLEATKLALHNECHVLNQYNY